jgi:PPM family protein phosphatase
MRYVAVSALSHDGLVRDHNEDSLVVGPWTLCAVSTPVPETIYLPVSDPVVVAVADGLGGHPAGEHASSLAVQSLARATTSLTDESSIREAIQACNKAIYADAARRPERVAMGTTIAGIVITDQEVIAFNVGDSRVYVLANETLTQLTVDDNEPPSAGQVRSPIVTQTLGGDFTFAPVEPHITSQPIDDDRRYVICSDGLTDTVDDPTIATVLRSHKDGRAAFELWKAAMEAGGPDNVTLALVDIATEQAE